LKKLIIILVAMSVSLMAIDIGKPLPSIVLSSKNGGYADGKAWHSKHLEGSVHLIIYMDPDKRKNIEPLMKAIRQTSSKHFTMVAIVNLAATWMPNRVLISKLNEQKSKMKRTEYVFDKKRILVSGWGLPDDDTTVIITDKKGRVFYQKNGKLSDTDVATILKKITH